MKFIKKIPNFVWLFLGAIVSFWVGCFVMSFAIGTWASPAVLLTMLMVFIGFFLTGMMSFIDWKGPR